MIRPAYAMLSSAICMLFLAGVAQAFPKPGLTPRSWQFVFEHSAPKRIVVTPKGSDRPQAYWYITYTVSNPGPEAQSFRPIFEMICEDGLVIRSDGKRYERVNGEVREVKRTITLNGKKHEITEMIPPVVLETIRLRERNPSLQSTIEIVGTLRSGADEAKDGVAIWPEPSPRMGQFSIVVTGLSGEIVAMKQVGNDYVEMAKDEIPGKDEKIVILRRTYRMRYQQLGDDKYPGDDRLDRLGEEWIYR